MKHSCFFCDNLEVAHTLKKCVELDLYANTLNIRTPNAEINDWIDINYCPFCGSKINFKKDGRK